ncbi:hypothetical protein B0H14DRAFT_2794293 [Mycena olivaceomarginata]|nr:hypothetical protein B0H14DRAFT_2794293 [Mycena olivaceomarginata]
MPLAVPPARYYPSDFFAALKSLQDVQQTAYKFEDLLFDNEGSHLTDCILDDLVLYEPPEITKPQSSDIAPGIDSSWILNRQLFTSADRFNTSCAPAILSQLSAFFQFTPTSVIDLADEERPVDERVDKRRLKQVKARRAAEAKAKAPLNPGPFERLEIPVPETREDVEEAVEIILTTQETILEEYLKALGSPELEASIQAACLPDELDLPSEREVEEAQAEQATAEAQTAASADPESLYPAAAQLMKFTALYCNSATGLGEWTISLSPRGERDLREHNRRDRKIFGIILKKIKELSNGHFSPDNQKRLNGNPQAADVPIYEAKMTGDLRLVYQIDCIPAYDATLTIGKAIKIFGVYTHAQIGRVSFWDTMGRELGKKGKEYKDRCAFRKRPDHAGDHVFHPSIFPAPAEVRILPTGCAPDLPPDDLEQVEFCHIPDASLTSCAIDAISSPSLLDSIIAGRDASFVLQGLVRTPKEQDIIEHPHSCYVLGRSGTGKTTTMLYKMLLVEADYELSLKEESQATPKRRQLFVTQSRILAEKVEEHFSKLSAGYQLSSIMDHAGKAKASAFALVDIDDELNWRSDLPKRYSDLRDEHFPLFVTFDRLCGMLENDMDDDPSSGFTSLSSNSSTDRATKPARLTYERFLGAYWPHFPQTLTKGLGNQLPPKLMPRHPGVIMGAEETLASASSFLDRDTYMNLSERAQSTFADQRQRIYDLFMVYMNQKSTHAILRYLDQRGVPVLRSICYNPNGLFWAGDTAQTISVGSSFRFNELKAFLYRIEQRRLETNKYPELSHQPVWQPRTFQLTINYRSHAGIVNCAHTVIEVITLFWPYSIDVLDRERGTVDGLRPVFFTGFDSGNVQYEQFLFGDREGSYIEFGAQQCILVRDDAAREKLREQVGDIGLIMTLYESKGLEFNDVLLYNFFEDSTVDAAQWRVVLNALETNRGNNPAPLFDKARHAGVCVELKFLYVAITRARNNILWTSRDQIQNCTPGTDTPRLAISSTAEEWEEQGRKLFANKRYRQSKHCFERALLPRQAAMAGAYYLRAEARKCPAGGNRQAIQARKTAFLEAATAFLDCAKEDRTVAYFRIAAECFEDGGEDLQAAHTYLEAREYTRSTELYRKLGNFDEAVDIVKNHKEEIRPEVVANVTNVARLFYFKEHKLEKANALFSSYEEALEYLEERFDDAAEVHLEEGRTFEAIKLFLRDRDNARSIRRGIECILQSLWRQVSFDVSPNEDPSVSSLLALAAKAEASFLPENERNELSMFQAICSREKSKLERLGESFEASNPTAALLSLDHCFTNPPKIQALRVDGVAKELQIFSGYVKLLNTFTWADPCTHPGVEKLFGYIRQGEYDFLIPRGTFLHSALRRMNHPAFLRSSDEENIVLDGSDLREVYHQALKERLRLRVVQENEMCKRTRAFSSCLTFSIFEGHCNRENCPHEHASVPTREEYNLRVRIHLQQILIFQTVQFIVNDSAARRYWISRLYSALYPSFYRLGSASSLDLASIPEAEAGFQVVKEWVRSWVYDFEFFPAPKFLSNLAQVARLSFQLDRKDAMSYLTNSPFMRMQPSVYMRPGNNYIVGEFLWLLEGKQEICLSAGVLFVRHILYNSLPINISVLCDVLEHLCACTIVADRQQHGLLHNITLPLSWLVNWASVSGEGPRGTHTFGLLAQCLEQLLQRLYFGDGAEHLLFENRNLVTLGWRIRDTFFARICRCVCLLAYHSSTSSNFRFKVLNHYNVSAYVKATSWASLVQAVRCSTADSPLDEMVVLLHVERPSKPIRNSREDIPLLLGTSRSLIESVSAQDSRCSGRRGGGRGGRGTSRNATRAGGRRTHGGGNTCRLETCGRRNAEMAKSNLAASCASFFTICLKEAEGIDWPDRAYRIRYLGPLPHLLLCLDVVLSTAQKQKKQIKKDLREAKHEKLEALDKQLTELTCIIQVQKTLGPTAAVHQSRDLASLKSHVTTAVQLMRNLPFQTPEGLTQHLERAYKGIVQPKVFVQASARKKPALNVDDLSSSEPLYHFSLPPISPLFFPALADEP